MALARQMQFVAFVQKFDVVSKSHRFLYRLVILNRVIVINACLYTYALDSTYARTQSWVKDKLTEYLVHHTDHHPKCHYFGDHSVCCPTQSLTM